ncbi:MAG: ATP-binding protein, partial [Pyrobaculum sp.]
MREIGIVVSGASVGSIPVQIYRSMEQYAVEEQLVGVVDGEDPSEIVVGFLRRVTKLEPVIKDRVRSPYVDKPEMVNQGILLPYTTAVVKPYVALRDGALVEISRVVTPGSKVYLLDSEALEHAF